MFQRILLAYDGSAPAHKAFERCLEMSQRNAAQLAIVAVVRPGELAEEVETEAVIDNARVRLQSELARLQQVAQAAQVRAAVHVRVGRLAEQILAAATECDADLIVIGHRGRGLLERWLMGSVSRVLITYARCAVLVVR
jgi:nucleotide-binding universal stress UspA family protein